MIRTSHEHIGGSEEGQFVVRWDEVDESGKLIDLGIIKCSKNKHDEFMAEVSDELTKKEKEEKWVLANR